jgi:hypothetical protein
MINALASPNHLAVSGEKTPLAPAILGENSLPTDGQILAKWGFHNS